MKVREATSPTAPVSLSRVSSWKATAVPQEAKETSNSTILAPFAAARRTWGIS